MWRSCPPNRSSASTSRCRVGRKPASRNLASAGLASQGCRPVVLDMPPNYHVEWEFGKPLLPAYMTQGRKTCLERHRPPGCILWMTGERHGVRLRITEAGLDVSKKAELYVRGTSRLRPRRTVRSGQRPAAAAADADVRSYHPYCRGGGRPRQGASGGGTRRQSRSLVFLLPLQGRSRHAGLPWS